MKKPLWKVVITVAFCVLTLLAIILLIQDPISIGSYASLGFCTFFDYIIFLLFFKKSSLLYKRFHEKLIDNDD